MMAVIISSNCNLAIAADSEDQTVQNQISNMASDFKGQLWNLNGQFTHVTQYHPSFRSPYQGINSLNGSHSEESTNDVTLYAGLHLWQGGEVYFNPEIDQGFGLSNTFGIAGFPSGEAYKVGKSYPYLRTQRIFFRQVIGLEGGTTKLASAANQLAGIQATNNLTFTLGKFSVVDIFDINQYAHDARTDFMNWSIIDSGAFDYAADAWGYTLGAAAEWTQSQWSLRAGLFALSKEPNSKYIDTSFGQNSAMGEVEQRYDVKGHQGKIKLLGFINSAKMGNYKDALSLARATNALPDTALVRRNSSRGGLAVNVEQEIYSHIGAFVRLSINDGNKEAYDFTEINRSLSSGLSLQGELWGRQNDQAGLAIAINGLSTEAQKYFAAGGLGILIGDGQLTHYSEEKIIEAYYSMGINKNLELTMDYQHINNPAYNPDRGPVSILGLRVRTVF